MKPEELLLNGFISFPEKPPAYLTKIHLQLRAPHLLPVRPVAHRQAHCPLPLLVLLPAGVQYHSNSKHMETVDIIDENNHVLNQLAKDEAHVQGLLHRCIIAEVIAKSGEWLLVKQASDRQDAHTYVSPVGGHIQANESEISALKREAQEELGLTEFMYKRIGSAIFNRRVKNRQENHYFILYEIYNEAEPILNHESVGFKRFTVLEMRALLKSQPQLFGDAYHFVVKSFYSR